MSFSSICIPRLESSLTKQKLWTIFQKAKIGKIEKITIARQKAFVYFSEWYSKEIKQKLLNGEDINLVYQFPFFIKCRANTNIHYLKNIYLNSQLKQQEKEINNLKRDLMYVNSYANYLSTNEINK